jgi:hypothetical protein
MRSNPVGVDDCAVLIDRSPHAPRLYQPEADGSGSRRCVVPRVSSLEPQHRQAERFRVAVEAQGLLT